MARKKTTRKEPSDTAAEEPPFDFEKGLDELERLVERMEQGEMSLEESLAAFERGVALTRSCQKALESAEQKVQILVEEAGGEASLEDLDRDDT